MVGRKEIRRPFELNIGTAVPSCPLLLPGSHEVNRLSPASAGMSFAIMDPKKQGQVAFEIFTL